MADRVACAGAGGSARPAAPDRRARGPAAAVRGRRADRAPGPASRQRHADGRRPGGHRLDQRYGGPARGRCGDGLPDHGEYGASIWCNPYVWIPEAARLLRRGGQLIFLVNSALLMLTVPDTDDQPATERLLRPYFGMHRFEWPADESVEFHLGHGDMIRLLRGCGLEVEDLLELRPQPEATTRYPFVTLEWARQ